MSKITGGQGSHNKPIGCSVSGAYAPGPDDEEEEGAMFMWKFKADAKPQIKYIHIHFCQDQSHYSGSQ